MIKLFLFAFVLACVLAAPAEDKMKSIPGYPDEFLKKSSIYSGYLDVQNVNRSIHYVFVQSINGADNKEPLTIWLNGGPGCSSLLGFLQEIGPYYLEDGKNYAMGDNLTFNNYSWHNYSNLLFLESPPGVGYSINSDKSYVHDDQKTATDNFNALLSFYQKFPEYKERFLFLAGESYAGKYIPDLAEYIVASNQHNGTRIRLKAMLIGNGIISFKFLQRSEVEFMIDRNFVDPETIQYWKSSCQTDPSSAGCRFFQIRYRQDIDQINPYNVYGICYYNDSFVDGKQGKLRRRETQYSILNKLKRQFTDEAFRLGSPQKVEKLFYSNQRQQTQDLIKIDSGEKQERILTEQPKYNGAPCAYFDGLMNYFGLNYQAYHSKVSAWNGPCADNINYMLDPKGSTVAYEYLLSRQTNRTQILLYSGNWDVVVPYTDTVKNIKALKLQQSAPYAHWSVGNQHGGFTQLYSGVIFRTVKGASHQVPQSKRAAAAQLFTDIIEGNKLFEPLPEHLKRFQE